MTATPKGYTLLDNSSPMAGPEQINKAERFVEDLIGESVATAANLPQSGNWLNRTIMTADTRLVYVCTALPGSWTKLSDLDDTGWIQAGQAGGPVLATSYANLITAAVPWSGLQARRRNGVVYLSGAITKTTTISVLETAFTMPVGWRPTATAAGFVSVASTVTIGLVRPDGTAATGASGAANSQLTFGLSYPV